MSSGTSAHALRRDALPSSFDAAAIGFKLLGGPIDPTGENRPIFQMDVHDTPRFGEYLRIWPGDPGNEVETLGHDRLLRQLVLRVREARRSFLQRVFRSRWRDDRETCAQIEAQGGTVVAVDRYHLVARFLTPDVERRYLCGRDEQRLFVAELPRGEAVDSVEAAHAALKPALVRLAESRWPGSVVRQGEWFFIPPSPADARNLSAAMATDPHAVRRTRSVGPGGEVRPHMADEVIRLRRSRARGTHRAGPEVVSYARGEVRHVDHFPLWLPEFHRVVLNRAFQPGPREGLRLRWID